MLGFLNPHKIHIIILILSVDKAFVDRQTKIFKLLQQITQVLPEAEYFKIGNEYKIEEHLESYTVRL